MPDLAELDLPFLDWTDEALKGDEFHRRMEALAAKDWLAGSEPGWIFVLDREAASYFLRSQAVVFPSAVVAQAFGITDGPSRRRDPQEHHLDRGGGPWAASQSGEPVVQPARGRPLARR